MCDNSVSMQSTAVEENTQINPETNLESEQFRKVFIGGINFHTNEEILKTHFNKYGEIIDCVVMRDPRTRRTRGFGFVAFKHSSSVDEVQRNRPHVIDGKEVETKRAMPREDADKPDSHITTKKLFIGGVKNPELSEDMLKDYFGAFGELESLDIIIDNNTGDRRGFAFVKFFDYDSVDKAAQMKNHVINGFKLEAKKALSRQEREFAHEKIRNQYIYSSNRSSTPHSNYRSRGSDGGRYEQVSRGSEYRGGYSKYPRPERDDYYRESRRYMPYGAPHSNQPPNYYMDYDPYGYHPPHPQYRERWDDQAPAYNRPWPDHPRGEHPRHYPPTDRSRGEHPRHYPPTDHSRGEHPRHYPPPHPYPRDGGYRQWAPNSYNSSAPVPNNPKNSNFPNVSAVSGYGEKDSPMPMLNRSGVNYDPSMPMNSVAHTPMKYGESINSYMHLIPGGSAQPHTTAGKQPSARPPPSVYGRYSNPGYRPF